MKLIRTLREKDLSLKSKKITTKQTQRKTARAVLFNKNNEVALMFASKIGYYKLPGGGVEGKESIKSALQRELIEETGYAANIKKEIGIIVEHRNLIGLKQISYCFIADVRGKKAKPTFTKSEKAHGFRVVWYSLDDAIEKIKSNHTKNYSAKFMVARDTTFLLKARELLK